MRHSVTVCPGDIGIAALFVVVAALTVLLRMPQQPGRPLWVEVRHPNGVQRLVLAGPPRTIQAAGCVVSVAGGRVRVMSSDCPHQCCVHTGWKSRAGDIIVCVPNRVVVTIVGDESPYDALAY